jgi:hypothetical protein
MNNPTKEQVAAAERLGINLTFANAPITIAQLVEIVDDMQRRLEVLELKKWPLRK